MAHVLPAKARNIRVEEMAGAQNYLALKDAKGNFLLNGDWSIEWSGIYKLGGTVIQYERGTDDKDKLLSPGPLAEPLSVMVNFQCIFLYFVEPY